MPVNACMLVFTDFNDAYWFSAAMEFIYVFFVFMSKILDCLTLRPGT